MTVLDRIRQWLAKPRSRLIAGIAAGVLVAVAIGVTLALALSGDDTEETSAATAGPDGSTAGAGRSSPGSGGGANGQQSPGDGSSPGPANTQGNNRTPRAQATHRSDPREFAGGEPSIEIPTVPPDQVNPPHPVNPPAVTQPTEVKPTATPTPRIPQWTEPIAQPPESGRQYCDTKTQSHPPDGRVAGAIQVNGANAPDGTKVEIAFDGTVGPSATTKADGSYAGYSLDVWASEDTNCANRAGAKVYVVVDGKWFDTGHTVGEGPGLYVLDVRA